MTNKWDVYPRPQLVRGEWLCLNGEWDFRTAREFPKAADEDVSGRTDNENTGSGAVSGCINVPFCPESKLSGIESRIAPGEKMIYEREVSIPDGWEGKRIILHLGAVDQIARVYVNGKEAGTHEGGYLPFAFDITELIGDDSREFRLTVAAEDELDHRYPWGKQKRNNGGMWYTPVSGIWQTVWMEPVAEEHIESLKIDTGADWVEIRAYGVEKGTIELLGEKHLMTRDEESAEKCASVHIDIHRPHLWSPEDPYLYDFTISTEGDEVTSYFALRTLTIEERDGYKRLCLNGEPYFFNGLLDQGYWQNGLYTPDDPQGFERDILAAKDLGFNTLRKHIKIEPEQFYYDCDRLGMIVFQDMVNNADYSFVRDSVLPTIGMKNRKDRRLHRDKKTREIFLQSMDQTVKHLYNHPSICYWTIFNEGWGQFDADEAYDRLKGLDTSRFIDSTSGWFDQNRSDVDSRHIYFKPIELTAGDRPLVLSEFGGYACKLEDHCFDPDKTYGYKKCENEAALLWDMGKLYNTEILPLVDKGLCAAIYTQLSDVEQETNGLLTYDREVQKIRTYRCKGRLIVIGGHNEQQGGRVLVAPSDLGMKAYLADNHSDVIRVSSEGFEPFEVIISERDKYEKGTTQALVAGILDGFADLFGRFDISGRGFDIHIMSEIPVGRGNGSSAAFEVFLARIINEKYFAGKADAVQLARIAVFAEREYYGRPCGMTDQLAVSLGRPAMIDFSREQPEIEYVEFSKVGLGFKAAPGGMQESDGPEGSSVEEDMAAVAKALGVRRLSDMNEVQFSRKSSELDKLIEKGELTAEQVESARLFYEENERVLAGAIALDTGNTERFLTCLRPEETGIAVTR